MRLVVAAVGVARNVPEQELCELYCKRVRALGPKLGFSKFDVTIAETSRVSTAFARMNEEAAKLIAKVPPGAHRIVLDQGGRSVTSEAFAAHLAKLRDSGARDLAFLIGGPDGLAASLRDNAQQRLAFGGQTWPHLLVRAMLAEQIYRAMTILAGHPYHRGQA